MRRLELASVQEAETRENSAGVGQCAHDITDCEIKVNSVLLARATQTYRPIILAAQNELESAVLKLTITTLNFRRLEFPALRTAADSDQIFLCSFGCKSNRFVPDSLIDRQYSFRPPAYCKQDLGEY